MAGKKKQAGSPIPRDGATQQTETPTAEAAAGSDGAETGEKPEPIAVKRRARKARIEIGSAPAG